MSKRKIFLPVAALGASVAFNYLKKGNQKAVEKNVSIDEPVKEIVIEKQIEEDHKHLTKFKKKKRSSSISRYLLKLLNNIDNNRLLFIEIKPLNRSLREPLLAQLKALKTEEPRDGMWIADFSEKPSSSRIIALVNKKAVFYLSNIDEVYKVRISAKNTTLKILGKSLTKLSTKFPSIEKYIFDPMLDVYSPLKETESISNLGIVAENQLYRGGMLVGDSNYDQLAELGVKTVINLKIEDSAVEYVEEQNALLKRNIRLHYIPMPNIAPPTLLQTMEFLTMAYNDSTIPVYFHCHRGSDRTGVMAAVFRITQGHTASWALVEAEKYNIASAFFQDKINFVYNFEKSWLKWQEEGKIPVSLRNFNFMSLIEAEEEPDNEPSESETDPELE